MMENVDSSIVLQSFLGGRREEEEEEEKKLKKRLWVPSSRHQGCMRIKLIDFESRRVENIDCSLFFLLF